MFIQTIFRIFGIDFLWIVPLAILRLFFSLILLSMGWKTFPSKDLEYMRSHKKAIYVFSHSSYWDFCMLFLYGLAYPELVKDVYTLMKPQVFKYWCGDVLKWFNFIPATKNESKGESLVPKIIKKMKKKDRFYLLISPEGKCVKSPWKSGYFYIARDSKIPILVVGLNYEKRAIQIKKFHHLSEDIKLDEIEKKLKQDISEIIPLHPNNSYTPIKNHINCNIMPIDPIVFTSCICSIIGIYYLLNSSFGLYIKIPIVIHAILSSLVSLYYHLHQEADDDAGKVDFFLCLGFIVHYYIIISECKLTLTIVWAIFIFLAINNYLTACGRQHRNNGKRYIEYIIHHSLFHIFICLSIIYPIV